MIPRSASPATVAAAALLVASVLAVALLPAHAAAQTASLRAVETVRPTTGERAIELMTPLTASEVAAVERRLAAEGHSPGAIDGRLDDEARRALRAFQRSRELDPCGCVDPPTARALGLELRVLVTRLADGGPTTGDGGEVLRASDSGAGVEVLYPTSAAAKSEASGEASAAASGPSAPSASGVEDVTGHAGLSGFGVHRGSVFPLPVPIFLGPGTPTPPEGQPAEARRGAFRLAPFPRVPMPPIRPPRNR